MSADLNFATLIQRVERGTISTPDLVAALGNVYNRSIEQQRQQQHVMPGEEAEEEDKLAPFRWSQRDLSRIGAMTDARLVDLVDFALNENRPVLHVLLAWARLRLLPPSHVEGASAEHATLIATATSLTDDQYEMIRGLRLNERGLFYAMGSAVMAANPRLADMYRQTRAGCDALLAAHLLERDEREALHMETHRALSATAHDRERAIQQAERDAAAEVAAEEAAAIAADAADDDERPWTEHELRGLESIRDATHTKLREFASYTNRDVTRVGVQWAKLRRAHPIAHLSRKERFMLVEYGN